MTHLTGWPEDRVLDYFWVMSRDADVDRIALLRQVSGVGLERPSDWDMRWVRQAAEGVKLTLTAEQCFACRSAERWTYWHHIIQVQHGGSSRPRNLVAICHRCHQAVHPWLPPASSRENRYGWTSMNDWAVHALQAIGWKVVREK